MKPPLVVIPKLFEDQRFQVYFGFPFMPKYGQNLS